MKGFIHVYTGDGKGKTTAALGLALRAVGANLRVYIGQFIKEGKFSELKALEKFSQNITVEQFGRKRFVGKKIVEEDRQAAQNGLKRAREIMRGGEYDLIILDEINIVLHYGLIDESDVIDMLKNRNEQMEVVLTGRNARKNIIDCADLVTEMRKIKHYRDQGVTARFGIEK
ncbi:MAG: cob(I)yrinic acid a,c-diamide adenosyltransferase [Candidatus Omnitrophica bacterium]|nr:cob(I)yrinic acid a,c-diamide adenosyltransferase [Candidatus Omnitrophota bacterium]